MDPADLLGGGVGTIGGSGYNMHGKSGTGGLLIIYTENLNNNGQIESNGIANGSSSQINEGYYQIPGGSSGGGSINIFYIDTCTTNAISSGGEATYDWGATSGAGGNGCVSYDKIEF